MALLGRVAAAVGCLVLFHCTYAVVKYRDLLKLTQQEFEGLPQQLQVELAVGTVLSLIGGCLLAGKLKPIVSQKGTPSMDAGSFRPDFVSFNHRGGALPYRFTDL